jgi:hypothetical protein
LFTSQLLTRNYSAFGKETAHERKLSFFYLLPGAESGLPAGTGGAQDASPSGFSLWRRACCDCLPEIPYSSTVLPVYFFLTTIRLFNYWQQCKLESAARHLLPLQTKVVALPNFNLRALAHGSLVAEKTP